MQHPIGSYAPRDRLAVGSYREANDTMSAAERVPLLAADSRRIAAALEASVVDPESLVASVSGRDDGAASSSDGRGRLVTAAALLALLGVAAIVGARGGSVGARLMTLGDGFQGASDGGTWGFAPAADRDGLGAGVDATAWDAGLGGGAVDTPWLGAGTFARDASDPAATPRWVQSLMPSAGERGDSVASMGDADSIIGAAAPRKAGEWSGKVQELVSALTQAVNGESKDDDAVAVAAVGAERGDAAGADDTAVHADATGPSAEMEASETGTHTKTAETLAFRVNVCGIPPIMRQNQAPWPVCKVWLVGCPGGAPCGIRSGDLKDGDEGFKPAWTHRADMTPADPGRLSIFEHVTDALAPGDEFAFMIAKPSCSHEQLDAAVAAGDTYADPTGRCEVRFDSGHPMGNHVRNPGRNEVTCWAGSQSSGSQSSGVGSLPGVGSRRGPGVAVPVTSAADLARLGAGDAVCRSRSPTSPEEMCVVRRGSSDPANTFRRVVPPPTESDTSTDDVARAVEFVWGTCDASPRSAAWCEEPAFDAAKVAAVCGVEYQEAEAPSEAAPTKDAASYPTPSMDVDAAEDEDEVAKTGQTQMPAARPVGGVLAPLDPRPIAGDDDSTVESTTSSPLSSPLPTVTVPVGSTDTSPGGGVTKKDIFGTGGTDSPAAFVPAGAWAETAEVTADLEGVGASKAVAHLVLRDGDQFFASENLPWARLVVNGEPVRIPHDVKHGDRVKLRVRAETAAEIEAWTSEDENASLGKRAASDGSSSETKSSSRGDPVRSATLKLGSYEGVLRARVTDRGARVTVYRQALRGVSLEAAIATDTDKPGKIVGKTVGKTVDAVVEATTPVVQAADDEDDDQETAAAKMDAATPLETPSSRDDSPIDESHPAETETKPKPGRMSFAHSGKALDASLGTPDGTPPETIISPAGVVHIRAPQPNQWVLVPPPDEDPIVVSGLGEGSTASVTVKLLHEIEQHGQGTLYATLGDEPLGLASDGREPPRGNANGVYVKVNSEDRSVKGGTVKVWTRFGAMEVPRPGVRETKVEVVDGDRLRLKIRSPGFGDIAPGATDKRPISGRYRVAMFVGNEWVGTAAVTSATSREEEREANAAFEGSIKRARAKANAAAAMGEPARAVETPHPNPELELHDSAHPDHPDNAGLAIAKPRAINESGPEGITNSRPSLISGRPVLVDEMQRVPHGVTRVVHADEWSMLPSRGFMRVSGVLPSAELRLSVHAYETKAGDAWLQRAKMDNNQAEATAAMGERDLSLGGNDEWIHAQLGAAPVKDGEEGVNEEAESDVEENSDEVDASNGLPDWVEVRVEGQVVTPPVSVWLSRRVSLRVKASPDDMVARRVVVRAGDQSWEATVISEGSDEISISPIPVAAVANTGTKEDAAADATSAAPIKAAAVLPEERAPIGTVSVRANASPRDVVLLPRGSQRDGPATGFAVDSVTGDLTGEYTPSLREAHSPESDPGVAVTGLGPGVTCEVTLLAGEGAAAEGRAKRWLSASTLAALGDSPGKSNLVPGWARLLVNGAARSLPYAAKDGDRLGVVIAAPGVTGGSRTVVLACPHDVEEKSVGAVGSALEVEYAASLVATVAVPELHTDAGTPDAEDAKQNTKQDAKQDADEKKNESNDGDKTLSPGLGADPSDTVRVCDASGAQRRERANKLIFDRESSMTYSDDSPNVCGSRPVCLGDGDAAKKSRDVVFVVDASDAVGRQLFDDHVLESLKTMYCASHEGTQSQASVILYPAPRNAKACGSHEVAVPLGRYTAREWFDAIDALKNDDESCCGFHHENDTGGHAGDGSGSADGSDPALGGEPARLPTGSAPLAEALDGAAAELDARGAHDPSNRLVVVVAAAVPSPVVKAESCSEDAPAKFTSMTRDWPFQKRQSPDSDEDVTACTYLWKHVPAAARRLKDTGARITGVHLAGLDEGGLASVSAGAGAHLVGAPWPGACDSDGYCSVQAQYGGELGRWLYGGEDTIKNDQLGNYNGKLGDGHADSPEHFVYDAGAFKTCEAVVTPGAAGQRERSIVSFPHSAHVRTLHARELSSPAGKTSLASVVSPLMCESAASTDPAATLLGGVKNNKVASSVRAASDDRICATEADVLGLEPVVSRCVGGDVAATSTCLNSLVFAACASVERRREEYQSVQAVIPALGGDSLGEENPALGAVQMTGGQCYNDGVVDWLRSTNPTDPSRGLTLGSVACDRVCRAGGSSHKVSTVGETGYEPETRKLGRMEVEIKCDGVQRCVAGAPKWYAPGREADARRSEREAAKKAKVASPEKVGVTD